MMKIFITRTFCDRDHVMNDVSTPYVLGDKIRIFCDEKVSSLFHTYFHNYPILLIVNGGKRWWKCVKVINI